MNPDEPDDHNLLARLGLSNALLLGQGGEARVYAASAHEVIRIMRPGASLEDALVRQQLLGEIAAGAKGLPFQTPVVRRVESIEGRTLSFEERLAGEPVSALLARLEGTARRQLVASYLDTALRIGDIAVARNWHGPLLGPAELRRQCWHDFLRTRLEQVAAVCPADLRDAVLGEAKRNWDEPASPELVHLDYFPANALARDQAVTAVIDFGPGAVMGDRRFDAWGAVAYLDAEISPHANDEDRQQTRAWLADHRLVEQYEPARRWIAASWTHATDDAGLMAWCRRVLLA